MVKPTEFWDQQIVSRERHEQGWLARLPVRLYVNESISRQQPSIWPVDWLRQRRGNKVWRRGLSIGCGDGSLERALIKTNLCERLDALDGSMGSLATATRAAREEGLADRIHYFAADFNTLQLPRSTYDVVFCNQSLHHVTALEYLMVQIRRALTEGGTLYIDEYIGPSRDAWSEQRIAAQRAIYASLPREWRLTEELVYPVEEADPSEAVRSEEILRVLQTSFDVQERRDYGGTLLALLVPMIDWTRAPETLVDDLIAREREMLAAGAQSYYTIVLGRPRRGMRGLISDWRQRRDLRG